MKKSIIISVILSLLSVEVVAAISLRFGLIKDIYSNRGFQSPKHFLKQGYEWRTEKEIWGAWHKPNDFENHVRSCFDITYNSNNLGARDIEDYDYKFGNSSIIALGDSFIEGYGLSHEDTLTTKLEKNSGRKVFNLGSSYHVGPLQYFLIYKEFSKKLPHEIVVLGFLPANDFTDNDLNSMESMGSKRFRPYYDINDFRKKYPIIYPKNSLKREHIGRNKLQNFIYSQLSRSNTIRLFQNLRIIYGNSISNGKISSYYRFSLKQQNAAMFYIKKLYNLAKENNIKQFIVLGIPIKEDLDFIGEKYKNRELAPWEKILINFSKENNDFFYIDGFNINNSLKKGSNYDELFLPCDGHWSNIGTSKNAELINSIIPSFEER